MDLRTERRPSPALAVDATFENSFKTLYPRAVATGLRPYGLRYRAQSSFPAYRVAEEFLVNTRIRRFDSEFELSLQGFFYDAPAVMASMVGEEPALEDVQIPLPAGFRLPMELGQAISRRRSRRHYSGESIRFEDIAAVIRAAAAVTATGEVEHARGGRTLLHFRITPSGGALYPIELHLAILNVDRVDSGLYRYDPLRDSLLLTAGQEEVERFLRTFAGGEETIDFSRAGAICLLIGRPWRAMRKYGPRGLRHLFIEAGHMAQNIHLACVGLGLGSVDCASIYDDEAHEVLHIDGVYETLVHTVVVGVSEDG